MVDDKEYGKGILVWNKMDIRKGSRRKRST
jgi:hypothetical protein